MITVFLPCREGSERILNKNTKDFSGVKGGLLSIKLDQLLNTSEIDKIVLSTNDEKVINIALEKKNSKIIIDRRAESLSNSNTSTDELIEYVPEIIDAEHILWTHVTSPFISSNLYSDAILKYLSIIKKSNNDSLMTVSALKTFIWDGKGAVNYDRSQEKWPRTQTLEPVYEINSAMFICSRELYIKKKDRIGNTPFLFELEKLESFDIDWPEDFEIAELLYKGNSKE